MVCFIKIFALISSNCHSQIITITFTTCSIHSKLIRVFSLIQHQSSILEVSFWLLANTFQALNSNFVSLIFPAFLLLQNLQSFEPILQKYSQEYRLHSSVFENWYSRNHHRDLYGTHQAPSWVKSVIFCSFFSFLLWSDFYKKIGFL